MYTASPTGVLMDCTLPRKKLCQGQHGSSSGSPILIPLHSIVGALMCGQEED